MKKFVLAALVSAYFFACAPNNVTIDSSIVKMMDSAAWWVVSLY